MKAIALGVGAVAVVLATLSPSVASARTDVFVHGRNQGPADTTDYWHIGYGANNDGVVAFTGNNAEANYVYAYDATQSWSDLSSDTMPVCALTEAMNSAPGTDIALLTHSAGGLVGMYMLAVAQNGWGNSCRISPATAKTWTTYLVSVAAPYRGSELANVVYGHTGGNFLQQACGAVGGFIANLVFNQASNMTWGLQTSMVQNNFASLTAYGSYGAIYQQWGTASNGDDGSAMAAAAWCSGMPSPNDGVVAVYSSSYTVPGGHKGWSDSVSHSSNRRNDYRTFAANVWAHNPY